MKQYTHAWLAFMAIKRLDRYEFPDKTSLQRTIKADATALVKCFNASRPIDGVGRSGCPMLRWYTFVPLFLAAAARGANLRIGLSGISRPRTDISGIFSYL